MDNSEQKKVIISQNLHNYPRKNQLLPKDYIKKYKADYYAFQEYPRDGKGFRSVIVDKEGNDKSIDVKNVEILWKKYFPWTEFRSGYWSETSIRFGYKKIVILNIHISTSYTDNLRLVILQRLKQLKGKRVLLVGDFNAAFKNQTDTPIEENHKFLSCIIGEGYTEKEDTKEKSNSPHYTFAVEDKDKNIWLKKKLDHVFISNVLRDDENLSVEIQYLDKVNINYNHLGYATMSTNFSDHTGIKICIGPASGKKTN